LVEATAQLQRRGHEVIVHVIGSEDPHSGGSIEYADLFRRRIEQLGMQKQIVLHGTLRQEEMSPIIARCHAFVAPYIETENGDKDGIPTAMLEAMASCLPVITTDSGSIREVVEHEVEGLLVPQRQSTALADAMQRLLRDAALEQRLAVAARARFEKQFDIRVTEQQLHDRITQAINSKP
jgi:colanic acid/amylovoran biosynthesis glycosyltransferase